MKTLSFFHDGRSRISARPLTLKEVLRLRDGMELPRTQPYQILKTTNIEKILLALN